jgi:ribulose-phosphate 3-epimerase
MTEPLIAPSVLSADFADLLSGLALIEASKADWIHLDVMDGRFVPPITFGAKMVSDVRKRSARPLDVHLMTVEPERLVPSFIEAGADWITFHPEACVHSHRLVDSIHEAGRKAGISIVPSTPVSAVEELLPYVDLVLVMTVNPGFGGQAILPRCLSKVGTLKAHRVSLGGNFLIAVDGGIALPTLPLVVREKPEVLVVGSAFFGASDPARLVREMKDAYCTPAAC